MRKKKTLKEELASCHRFNRALKLVAKGKTKHDFYRHYTTIGSLLKMMDSNSWRLTLGKSAKLDDSRECMFFGDQAVWSRTYIACFSHMEEESAAMWGLYCHGNAEAICITIPKEALFAWKKTLEGNKVALRPNTRASIEKSTIKDIAYVKCPRENFAGGSNSRYIEWGGVRTKNLRFDGQDIKDKILTGALKGHEWAFEYESRLIVQLKRAQRYQSSIEVKLPEDFFKEIEITMGPWCGAKLEKLKKRLNDAFTKKGVTNTHDIRVSSLKDALRKWAKDSKKERRR